MCGVDGLDCRVLASLNQFFEIFLVLSQGELPLAFVPHKYTEGYPVELHAPKKHTFCRHQKVLWWAYDEEKLGWIIWTLAASDVFKSSLQCLEVGTCGEKVDKKIYVSRIQNRQAQEPDWTRGSEYVTTLSAQMTFFTEYNLVPWHLHALKCQAISWCLIWGRFKSTKSQTPDSMWSFQFKLAELSAPMIHSFRSLWCLIWDEFNTITFQAPNSMWNSQHLHSI